MHNGIKDYVKKFKHLSGENNLEVGSLDVNGSIRDIIPITVGVDMRPGKGVDLVCMGEELPVHFSKGQFELVVSTETLEHVRDWREFLQGVWEVLTTGGHFICTLAGRRKGRHAYPDDYWRMDEDMVKAIFKEQEIIDINTDISGISFGFVVKKKAELQDLTNIHLIPVDKKVPKELLQNG